MNEDERPDLTELKEVCDQLEELSSRFQLDLKAALETLHQRLLLALFGWVARQTVGIAGATGALGGLGLLLTPQRVLTCAHVVAEVTGADEEAEASPEKEILVEFSGIEPPAVLKARVEQWEPASRGEAKGDLCLLALEGIAPFAASEPPWASEPLLPDHPLTILASGQPPSFILLTLGPAVDSGWLPIRHSTPELTTRLGYTGAPVFDPVQGTIFGLLTADISKGAVRHYLIPAPLLLDWLPDFTSKLKIKVPCSSKAAEKIKIDVPYKITLKRPVFRSKRGFLKLSLPDFKRIFSRPSRHTTSGRVGGGDDFGPSLPMPARPDLPSPEPPPPDMETTEESFPIPGPVVGAPSLGAPPRVTSAKEAPAPPPVSGAESTQASPTIKTEELLAKAPPRPPQERQVNTGFAGKPAPHQPWGKRQPLDPGGAYWFWLEIGPRSEGAIDAPGSQVPLPVEMLPPLVRLTVALYSYGDGFQLDPSADIGELRLLPDGTAEVARQPGASGPPEIELQKKRLLFPVQAPPTPSLARLRCNIYCRGQLVQGRVIEAHVGQTPPEGKPALVTTLDYCLSRNLAAWTLSALPPVRLSLMLNGDDATHEVRFFGGAEFDAGTDFKAEGHFNAVELTTLLDEARQTLRQVAWGDAQPWTKQEYRYASRPAPALFKADLVRMAWAGYRCYFSISQRLAGGVPQVKALTQRLAAPGFMEIALKEEKAAGGFLLPGALLYDHPLDTSVPLEKLSLCPEFCADIERGSLLEASRCFAGHCPSQGIKTIVCPSGFWGFRHFLAFPLSGTTDLKPVIAVKDRPHILISAFPGFSDWTKHREQLARLTAGCEDHFAETRQETIDGLRLTAPHLVYFYCHGGQAGAVPYLQVGREGEIGISPDNLLSEEIWWESPRPLVFINGCHTTALEPRMILDFVRGFITTSNAAGVIGTEITVFEPLARGFAEAFFPAILAGRTVGQAVREARLALLQQGNPLGLAYVPFVIPGMKIKLLEA